jgi:hypothetical protein
MHNSYYSGNVIISDIKLMYVCIYINICIHQCGIKRCICAGVPWHSILLIRIPYLPCFWTHCVLDIFPYVQISLYIPRLYDWKTSWSLFIYINSITDCVWPKMVATCFVLNGWWTSWSLTRAGIRSLDHPTSTLISILTTLCQMPVYLKNKKKLHSAWQKPHYVLIM